MASYFRPVAMGSIAIQSRLDSYASMPCIQHLLVDSQYPVVLSTRMEINCGPFLYYLVSLIFFTFDETETDSSILKGQVLFLNPIPLLFR